jgi:hypothetical protein
MGQNQSGKRLPKEQREQRETLKKNTLEQRKIDITQARENFLKSNNEKALVPTEQLSTLFKITETAKNQLDRGGATLTKSDLIAVIIALEPRYQKEFNQLGELTLSDLNTMIRSIIYDPNRLSSTPPTQKIKNNNIFLLQ